MYYININYKLIFVIIIIYLIYVITYGCQESIKTEVDKSHKIIL